MARIHVLEGYSGGKPVRHFLCFGCADSSEPTDLASDPVTHGRRLAVATLLIVAGAAMMLLGAFADYLHWHGSAGVGWVQRLGLAAGVLLILTGALLRADLLALGGSLLFAVCAAADLFGTLGSTGFGWKQLLLIVAGTTLTIAGYASRSPRDQAVPQSS